MNDNNGKILALDKPFSGVKKAAWHMHKNETIFFQEKNEKSDNSA